MDKIFRVSIEDVRLFHVDIRAKNGAEALGLVMNQVKAGTVEPIEDEESEEGYKATGAHEIKEEESDLAE